MQVPVKFTADVFPHVHVNRTAVVKVTGSCAKNRCAPHVFADSVVIDVSALAGASVFVAVLPNTVVLLKYHGAPKKSSDPPVA